MKCYIYDAGRGAHRAGPSRTGAGAGAGAERRRGGGRWRRAGRRGVDGPIFIRPDGETDRRATEGVEQRTDAGRRMDFLGRASNFIRRAT